MPISVEAAAKHVAFWSDRLKAYPLRGYWPNHLFHTCDITVAVEILRRRQIISRNSAVSGPGLICDVANQGALWNNPIAHDYVRFYFRPKNKFHLKTEGIKSLGDPYRAAQHMTIPVAFLFKFQEVLNRDDCFFLPENFALTGAEPLTGDNEFAKLDFLKIYHDSSHQSEDIHRARMAEAVVRGRIDLSHCSAVLVRNEFDRRTLLHLTGARQEPKLKCFVDQRGGVFFKRGMHLLEATLLNGALFFSFSGPSTGPKPKYAVCITQGGFSESYELESARRWKIHTGESAALPVKIEIEGCLAFEGCLPSGSSAVV